MAKEGVPVIDLDGHTAASSSLVDAAFWARDLLAGSIATAVAVLAIAWLGFAMLQGHLPWRSGGRMILGCFVLFGASTIASGLVGLAHTSSSAVFVVPPPPPSAKVPLPARPPVFDPYAGASVPN